MPVPVLELETSVLAALFEMEDNPHPTQAYGDVAVYLGLSPDEQEDVYKCLLDLEALGLVQVAERRYAKQGLLHTATGWCLVDRAQAEEYLGRTPPPTPGHRSRLSPLAARSFARPGSSTRLPVRADSSTGLAAR